MKLSSVTLMITALLPTIVSAVCAGGGYRSGDTCHNYNKGDKACGDHVVVSNLTVFSKRLQRPILSCDGGSILNLTADDKPCKQLECGANGDWDVLTSCRINNGHCSNCKCVN